MRRVVTKTSEVLSIETKELLQDFKRNSGIVGNQEVLCVAFPLMRVHDQQTRVHVALHATFSAGGKGVSIVGGRIVIGKNVITTILKIANILATIIPLCRR